MTNQTHRKRSLALTLAALMTAGSLIPSAAAPIGNGVTPTYDEAYYATLDYYGNLLEGSVVKSYALNGAAKITDYGTYDEVVNLTDSTPVKLSQGQADFQFSQAPGHFYFEGKTAQPFQNLPWTVSLSYSLNGVPVRAEELAGQKGVVEITMDVVPSRSASAYARYNYTLEAAAMFNQDDILSLEAPGAQVQLVGNLRTVLFMALPGEEQHFTIRVGSDDFSFNGMTVLMVPATLSQLEEIAKLSQRKDELEEDYRALSGSLDTLLDALNDIQGGLYASASGLDQLNTARGTISSGKGQLYDDAGVLREDLSGIADLLEPVEERVLKLSQTITDSKASLNEMADTAVSLKQELDDLETALKGLEDGTGDVKQVIYGLADMKNSLKRLERALNNTGGSSGGSSSSSSVTDTVDQVKKVHRVYESAGNDTAFISGMLQLSGKAGSPEDVIKLQGLTLEQFQGALAAGLISGVTEADWRTAQELKQLQQGVQGGMSFQSFCESLPGISKSQAKQMADLWTIYSSGGTASGVMAGALAGGMLMTNPLLAAAGITDTDGGAPGVVPQDDSPSPAADGADSTVGSAAVDLIASGLDSANSKISAIQRELNSTINRITGPTASVVGELADLCDDVEELAGLLNDASDLSAALRQASGKLSAILDSVDSLRNTLNDYEPTLQEGLASMGALSTSAAASLRDLETLLADTEALMQTSGAQLDEGTRQTLKGLSAALRQTGKALSTTQDVKNSKNALTDIIEDTWHEYTGDINNLLLMDAEARAVSLTDPRNPTPSSVQILIRTQEIKAEDEEGSGQTAQLLSAKTTADNGTFWSRVAQMFKDFWLFITGIFR